MTSPQLSDDPMSEGLGKLLQALAVLTTVGEAATRFAAVGAQNRAVRAERRADAGRVADAARQQADQAARRAHAEQQRTDRRLMNRAFEPTGPLDTDIVVTAELWRTATIHAMNGDQRAAEAMRRAKERLQRLSPQLVDAYDRNRAAGMSIAEAMPVAAYDVWQNQTQAVVNDGAAGSPMAHGATLSSSGSQPVDLDAAVAAEILRLAADVEPDVVEGLQRQWRSAGRVPAAEAASTLASAARQQHAANQEQGRASEGETIGLPREAMSTTKLAVHELESAAEAVRAAQVAAQHFAGVVDQERRNASMNEGAVDLAATVQDEHRDGITTGHVRRADALHEQSAIEQLRRLGQAFPPLLEVIPATDHPTPDSKPGPARRKGQTR